MILKEFEKVYALHNGWVYRLAYSYVKNGQEAEDITQEVFIKVFEKIHQFEGKSLLKTWIFSIAKTTCLDYLKAKSRKKRKAVLISLFSPNGSHIDIQDKQTLPDNQLENKELLAELLAAVDQLKENQRHVFYLSQMEGLGNIEIAQIIQKSVGATESLLQRAKTNLQAILGKKYLDNQRNTNK